MDTSLFIFLVWSVIGLLVRELHLTTWSSVTRLQVFLFGPGVWLSEALSHLP